MKPILSTLVLVLGLVGCSSNDPLVADDSPLSSSSATMSKAIDDGGNTQAGRVEGTISAINVAAKSLTITTARGIRVTTFAVANTKIERNGFHVSLDKFKIGDRGQARFNPATMIASKMQATGN